MFRERSDSSISPAEFQAIALLLKKTGREIESTIHGTSMDPTIPHGARIKVCPSESVDYQVGQIIACMIGHSLFAHRIVYCGHHSRTRAFVLTQGDGWLFCDRPIRKDAILGVVTGFSVDGVWHVPANSAPRRPWQQALATAHLWMIKMCLLIHHEFARRVSGIFLTLGAILKRLHWKPKTR